VNERGETSIPGLYAAGNCSDGAYMRMGQALPGCSVMGAWAGESASAQVREREAGKVNSAQVGELASRALAPLARDKGVSFQQAHKRFERLYVDVIDRVLTAESLERSLQVARSVRSEDLPRMTARDPHELTKVNALKNFVGAFEAVLMVLLRRKESRGNVLREDCPETDNVEWAKFTVLKKEWGDAIRLWEEPIPEDDEHTPHEKTKTVHSFFR
jgi:succinate dehydrogenase / fumarate reductase flavoprotein subunit